MVLPAHTQNQHGFWHFFVFEQKIKNQNLLLQLRWGFLIRFKWVVRKHPKIDGWKISLFAMNFSAACIRPDSVNLVVWTHKWCRNAIFAVIEWNYVLRLMLIVRVDIITHLEHLDYIFLLSNILRFASTTGSTSKNCCLLFAIFFCIFCLINTRIKK